MPPYNVDYAGKTAKKLKIGNDALGGKFYDFLRESCANMLAVCKGAMYVCMSSSELHTLYQAFTDTDGHWSTFVIWAKHHFTLSGKAVLEGQSTGGTRRPFAASLLVSSFIVVERNPGGIRADGGAQIPRRSRLSGPCA
jgi:hypothetical protein